MSNEGPAISGSLDYRADNGFYLGWWQTSEGHSYSGETDLYVGYQSERSGVGFDLGAIAYIHPQDEDGRDVDIDGDNQKTDVDYQELYLNLEYGSAALSVAHDAENSDTYVSLGGHYKRFTLLVGSYDFHVASDSYLHIDLTYSPLDDITFGISKNDFSGDQSPRLFVTYKREFVVE